MACSACGKKKERSPIPKRCTKCAGFIIQRTLPTRHVGTCSKCGKVYEVRR